MKDGKPVAPLAPPDERSLASARLLIDLFTNTLDPGYAAAAKRRGPDTRRKAWEQPAVAVGCLLIGFLLVVAYVHTNRGAPEAQKVHDRLVNRVRSAEHEANELSGQLAKAESSLAAEQARELPASGAIAQNLQRVQEAAGQVAVHGPGLVVTLREPPAPTASAGVGRVGTTPIGSTFFLTDRDVRAVVNQLWNDGAEAIAVNDIRLTPTSAIRFAGQAVLVDFQQITSPYRITAIGRADDLSVRFAESGVASRYQTLAGADNIGFTFTESASLSLPASGPVTPRYASPAPASSARSGR